MFYFHPYLGKIPNLTNIFQMGGSTTNQSSSENIIVHLDLCKQQADSKHGVKLKS